MFNPFEFLQAGLAGLDVAAASVADAAALKARQDRRLVELLRSAVRGSSRYRALLKGRDVQAWRLQDLPVAHKAELMADFDAWVCDPALKLEALRDFTRDAARIGEAYLGRYTVWESSGSSGAPGIFVQDACAMAVYDALEALRRPQLRPLQALLDPFLLGERIAFVGAIDGHFASTVSIQRLRRLVPAWASRVTSLSFLQPMPALLEQLQAAAPTLLTTYPTVAVLLAQQQRAGALQIAPREVWTGGETLSPAMRGLVQQAFGCPLVNSYGASEFLALACECRCGGLHLNSDWALIEAVDETGRVLPPGVPGASCLLTNLANHVQPLIRYDLGDRVRISATRCACGSALPSIEVEGRCDDVLSVGPADGAAMGTAVQLLPLALTTVLEESAGLFEFQLRQLGPDALLLSTPLQGVAADAVLARARAVLLAFLASQGAPDVSLRCVSGVETAPGRSGKLQRIVGLRQGSRAGHCAESRLDARRRD